MKKGIPCAVLTGAILGFSHFGALAQTNVIIVPRERATSFGSWSAGLFGAREFLQLYGQDEFVELPVDVVQITRIAFRWDEHYQQPFERVIDYVILQMGISNSQGDTFEDYLPNPTLVFRGENVRFAAPESRPASQFDVAFILEKPFVYDRRLGRLVIRVAAPAGPAVDAESNADRGSNTVSKRFDGGLIEEPITMVTQFSYIVPPIIDSIEVIDGSVELDFTIDSQAESQIEAAPTVSGPYAVEEQAEIVEIKPGRRRAFLLPNTQNRFYRVVLQ